MAVAAVERPGTIPVIVATVAVVARVYLVDQVVPELIHPPVVQMESRVRIAMVARAVAAQRVEVWVLAGKAATAHPTDLAVVVAVPERLVVVAPTGMEEPVLPVAREPLCLQATTQSHGA